MQKAVVLAIMVALAFALALPAPSVGQPPTDGLAVVNGHGTLDDGSRFSLSVVNQVVGDDLHPVGNMKIGEDIFLIWDDEKFECNDIQFYAITRYLTGWVGAGFVTITTGGSGVGTITIDSLGSYTVDKGYIMCSQRGGGF